MKPRNARALQLLMEGNSITDICKELDINRSTYYRYIANDPEFKAKKDELENQLLDELYSISLMETKENLINSNNPYYKLQVLQSLLKIKHSEKLEVINKNITLDDLLEDL